LIVLTVILTLSLPRVPRRMARDRWSSRAWPRFGA